jgi:ADP-ribose pyrophosphatase
VLHTAGHATDIIVQWADERTLAGANVTAMSSTAYRDETVFEGRRIRVLRRRFEFGGRTHTHEVVVHPGVAVILPVLDDGRIVLIHNQRFAIDQELIELPAGTLEPGEEPAVCAARELAEETGYRAGRVTPLMTLYSSPGITTEHTHAFLATGLVPGPTAHDSGEQIRVLPMPLAEAFDGIHTGRITDGKTIATLLYYDRFVRGKGAAV